jgi:ribonuclease HII
MGGMANLRTPQDVLRDALGACEENTASRLIGVTADSPQRYVSASAIGAIVLRDMKLSCIIKDMLLIFDATKPLNSQLHEQRLQHLSPDLVQELDLVCCC